MPAARRILFATATAALMASSALGGVAAAAPAEHDPVIFVHGWNGSAGNWNELIADFKADGYTDEQLYTIDYDTTQSNETTAAELSAEVDRVLAATGSSTVDIVSHSMGGMNSRWYVTFLGGVDKVDDWASLAGANHGTEAANTCAGQASCQEMIPGSEFLTKLNEGDETPGSVGYGTWWSPCDGIINPAESTVLDGATNTKIDCLDHLSFLFNDEVSAQVRGFVS